MVKKYSKSGWFKESKRHSLASKGIKTGRKNYSKKGRERAGSIGAGVGAGVGGVAGSVLGGITLGVPGSLGVGVSGAFVGGESGRHHGEFVYDVFHKKKKKKSYAKKPKIEVYDNSGRTADRYTVVVDDDVYFMSDNPTHPQGVNVFAGNKSKVGFVGDKLKKIPDGVKEGLKARDIDFAKKDWKKADWVSFADYQWHTPDSSLSISHVQDRDGKNAFVYSVNLMSGLRSLGGVRKKLIWKGRNEKLAMQKAKEYMEQHSR